MPFYYIQPAGATVWRLTVRGKAGAGTGSTRYAVFAHGGGGRASIHTTTGYGP